MIVEHIIDLIAPHYCLGCNEPSGVLCYKCSANIKLLPPRCYACQALSASFNTCNRCVGRGLSQVFCATEYSGLAKDIVRKLKFGRSPRAAKDISKVLSKAVPTREWLIVPVPTAASRVRQRGYDQARLIAKELARENNLDYSALLVRSGRKRQVGQTRRQRQEQISGAFKLFPAAAHKIASRHILLVDDVVTTGATLEAAAKILRPHKPATICAAVFAAA